MAHYLVGQISEVNAMTPTYIRTRPVQEGGIDKLGASEKNTSARREPVDVDDEVVSMLRLKRHHRVAGSHPKRLREEQFYHA